ncbi:hypothetical protein [Stenotrophomonas maltophilia]
MEDSREEQRAAALSILIESGAVESCDDHEEVLIDVDGDAAEAYKLATIKFKNGQLAMFDSLAQLRDEVNAALLDCASECWACDSDREG